MTLFTAQQREQLRDSLRYLRIVLVFAAGAFVLVAPFFWLMGWSLKHAGALSWAIGIMAMGAIWIAIAVRTTKPAAVEATPESPPYQPPTSVP